MAHRNIPIFIPHMGCPHQCVFCNQRSISGQMSFSLGDVGSIIESALSTVAHEDEVEIAFFGGSFTGIDQGLMVSLLDLAQEYVNEGRVTSIRLSTRPDYISKEILDILSHYAVRVIELGLQSMDERVLAASGRGHTAGQACLACRMITARGFDLVGQMMIGLPASTRESELATAREICDLGATAARIYPTVVFYQTPLQEQMHNGEYTPLSVEDAVSRSADVLEIFSVHQISCIRIGLCASESLTSPDFVAGGPNHPALGELVWNEYYYRLLLKRLREQGLMGREVVLYVPADRVSQIVGQHRNNINRLLRETDTRVYKIVGEENRHDLMPLLRQRS